MKKYRVAYRHPDGNVKHGDWLSNKEAVEAWVYRGNAKYPDIKHWMEEKDDEESENQD